ncbi:GAF domain-containing protein [bacterium]|nr:GAF domain-containing protein [bacterium]
MNHRQEIPAARTCAECQVERDLAAALRLQRLLAEISSRFVTRPAGQVDGTIEETQRLVCETLGLDRSTLWQADGGNTEMGLTHFWQRPGSVPLRRNFITEGNLPWAQDMVSRGEPFHFSSPQQLPPEAARDVETLRLHGSKSIATFPLVADGKVFGALAFASTTAERRWTDDEISGLKLVAQLFGHVISRRRAEQQVEQLRDEIQRAARASELGEIAAALAHEINQPLTTILANAQAARRFIDQETSSPAEIRAILDDIIRDDKRAAAVVHHLREMLAGSPARRETSCLNRIVREVAGFLSSELSDGQVELQLDLATPPPRIRAARVEIQQLLINLLGNALHALSETPPLQRHILIQTRSCGRWVKLRIRDPGCGIPTEHLDRIFEPFHTTRSGGLGMGLAICLRIATTHGGHIVAANVPAGGAMFELSLPVDCGSLLPPSTPTSRL